MLIAEQKRIRGFSYGDLANRAGNVISRQRWQQLGSGHRVTEFSEPATLIAMARALDVDQSLIVLAMAKSIGLQVDSGGFRSTLASMLPATTAWLTAEQRHAIVGIIRAMTEEAPYTTVDRLLDRLVPEELSDVGDKAHRMVEQFEAELDRVYREDVTSDEIERFREQMGMFSDDDHWWADDPGTLLRTWKKIAYQWGYGTDEESLFRDTLRSMSGPPERPTPESHYQHLYDLVQKHLVNQMPEPTPSRREKAADIEPAVVSGEAGKAREAVPYALIRCNPNEPGVIVQGGAIDALDDNDARRQLYRALDVAGMTIDSRSDRSVIITRHGGKTTLIGIVREDASHQREEHTIAKLKERASQLESADSESSDDSESGLSSRLDDAMVGDLGESEVDDGGDGGEQVGGP